MMEQLHQITEGYNPSSGLRVGQLSTFIQLGQNFQVCVLDAFLRSAVTEHFSIDMGQKNIPCHQFCCYKQQLIISNRATKLPGRK